MTAADGTLDKLGCRAEYLSAAVRLLMTFPGTVSLTALIIAAGVLTRTVLRGDHAWILDHVGTDAGSLAAGRVWTMPLATVIQADAGIKWHQALFVLLFVGLLEYQVGAPRAIAAFFLTDWLSSPATVGVLLALGALGSSTAERLAHTPDMGSSAAALGAFAAAIALAPSVWRNLGVAGLFGVLIFTFTFERLDVSIAHVLAATTAFAVGPIAFRRVQIRTLPLPSLRREGTRA